MGRQGRCRAALALDLLPHLEEQARERMLAAQNNAAAREIIPELGEAGRARDKAAALVGTNARYVSGCKKLAQPDHFQLRRGFGSLSAH